MNGKNSNTNESQKPGQNIVSDALAKNSRQLLYAHIYNYLMENNLQDTARILLREADVPISNSKDSSNPGQSSSMSGKDIKSSDELPGVKMLMTSPDTFLLEWWQSLWALHSYVKETNFQQQQTQQQQQPQQQFMNSNLAKGMHAQLLMQQQQLQRQAVKTPPVSGTPSTQPVHGKNKRPSTSPVDARLPEKKHAVKGLATSAATPQRNLQSPLVQSNNATPIPTTAIATGFSSNSPMMTTHNGINGSVNPQRTTPLAQKVQIPVQPQQQSQQQHQQQQPQQQPQQMAPQTMNMPPQNPFFSQQQPQQQNTSQASTPHPRSVQNMSQQQVPTVQTPGMPHAPTPQKQHRTAGANTNGPIPTSSGATPIIQSRPTQQQQQQQRPIAFSATNGAMQPGMMTPQQQQFLQQQQIQQQMQLRAQILANLQSQQQFNNLPPNHQEFLVQQRLKMQQQQQQLMLSANGNNVSGSSAGSVGSTTGVTTMGMQHTPSTTTPSSNPGFIPQQQQQRHMMQQHGMPQQRQQFTAAGTGNSASGSSSTNQIAGSNNPNHTAMNDQLGIGSNTANGPTMSMQQQMIQQQLQMQQAQQQQQMLSQQNQMATNAGMPSGSTMVPQGINTTTAGTSAGSMSNIPMSFSGNATDSTFPSFDNLNSLNSTTAVGAGGANTSTNPGIQDYQMHLMMLENQTMKAPNSTGQGQVQSARPHADSMIDPLQTTTAVANNYTNSHQQSFMIPSDIFSSDLGTNAMFQGMGSIGNGGTSGGVPLMQQGMMFGDPNSINGTTGVGVGTNGSVDLEFNNINNFINGF